MKEAEIKRIVAENESLKASNKQLKDDAIAKEVAKNKQLKAELVGDTAKEFELVDWVGSYRQNFGKFGIIDLSKLTPKQADRLVKRGFKKIQRIKK